MQDNLDSFNRSEWIERLFLEGVPTLWCPPLTHYDRHGAIDAARMEAHLHLLSRWVKALLVPGSTGDGWELTSDERDQVLEVALRVAQEFNLRVLVGALHPNSVESQKLIQKRTERLRARSESRTVAEALVESRVCGFAVCPPRGSALSQEQIEAELSGILDLAVPTALYQLPQVTQNEMSAGLVSRLAERFGNFILFKDTSGQDAVAKSGRDLHGVFQVRGMEGEYERWLKPAGGPYDGFLLSAANCFAEPLHHIIEWVHAGRLDEARALSDRISAVVTGTFAAVKTIPDGNAFANGGKALDHFMAYGPRADQRNGPRLHSGRTILAEILQTAGALLTAHGLMPARGYLE